MNYLKSPMNYIGNKYKLLDKIFEYFPKDINLFLDVFCGGGDVSINVNANLVYANDINYHIIKLYKALQNKTYSDVINQINGRIAQYGLSKNNEEGFKKFRAFYNSCNYDEKAIDLFILLCYSFNNQMRFNNKQEYNSSFGRNRSDFNDTIKTNLEKFYKAIQNIKFSDKDYADFDYSILKPDSFIYADPPYSLGVATYNDGKRGFKGWTKDDDKRLYNILRLLSQSNIRFALSNVIKHKGETNTVLYKWAKENGFNIININHNYKNCNYQLKRKDTLTQEVLITNY